MKQQNVREVSKYWICYATLAIPLSSASTEIGIQIAEGSVGDMKPSFKSSQGFSLPYQKNILLFYLALFPQEARKDSTD